MRNLTLMHVLLTCLSPLLLSTSSAEQPHSDQPNILWVITDDHRADSIQAYNRETRGQDHSELGYVSSPSADALAQQGVLFTRAYCNSPGCAPSRTSMHFGMYPHHSGQYGFESGHQSADFCKPMFPTLIAQQGYQTAHFGKSGFASFDWSERKLKKTTCYQTTVDQKELYANERVDWFHHKTWSNGKADGDEAFWAMPDGGIYIRTPLNGSQAAVDLAKKTRVEKELDLLYRLGDRDGLVIGGVSPQPTAETQDGNIVSAFSDYLIHAGESYQTPWGRELDGATNDKPVFVNLGFHFPHTPVLPSQEFRDQFAGKTYKIPEFSKDELKKLPPQLVQWFKKTNFVDMDAADQQQAIRDYYAFCAMGDFLVGQAVEQFKLFSEKQHRDYVILYVIGDHGWHLGEQGGESKFAPYDTSNHCAVIAVSSDGERYPANTVCDAPIEFVDFAPTFLNLAGADLTQSQFAHLDGRPIDETLSGDWQRDYVIGEMNHHIGPRAYLRSGDFAFSMRVREKNGQPGTKWGHPPGEGVRWALDAPPNDVELALFDLRVDPNEHDNVANDTEYIGLADWFRKKLGNIVLGDGRVECDWTQPNRYTISNFAKGAHDGKLAIPADLIPSVAGEESAYAPDLKIEFGPVARKSVFVSDVQSHWGGSLVKGDDGLYHMLYSRWPKDLGWAWVTDSEVAHATSSSPFGPFEFKSVALPRRGKEHWDGWCTHNPTVHRFGDQYYLYYMGNTGDGVVTGTPGKESLNWKHRNNQRIGVAVADSPNGPWKRSEHPLIDVSADDQAYDCLMTSNPSVCQRPDGGFLMVYKGVGKKFPMPNGGPVVHCIATSDSPTGPFKKHAEPVFTFENERFPAEDPWIWFQDGKYRAVVKRIKHEGRKRVFSLVQYDSVDGFDWQPAKHHEISIRTVVWEDGEVQQFEHLERPQVLIEGGVPVALLCAADTRDENRVRHSFNIQIPLVVTRSN
ncbi:Arylsulfatase A [Neorhodopirellula lusitana]|uniref:Arylsulfatase A n=1 Tax=Neorhodopirellula lusitana TaxID=445327 RepID=A0ABY1PRF1_9BACT|nr:sulfatase-like hydrolase/transferase [Neorhodopirellula lusitana]SMP43759.1 Arylsulfatase A [Neorhodopirellula lusitana]